MKSQTFHPFDCCNRGYVVLRLNNLFLSLSLSLHYFCILLFDDHGMFLPREHMNEAYRQVWHHRSIEYMTSIDTSS